MSNKTGKAKGGVKGIEPPAKRLSPWSLTSGNGSGREREGGSGRESGGSGRDSGGGGSGGGGGSNSDNSPKRSDRQFLNELHRESKEISRSEYDTKDQDRYFPSSEGEYGRSKRHSISSTYEDDFEEEDLDDGRVVNNENIKHKNRFK